MNPGFYNIISVAISADRIPSTLVALEQRWKKLTPQRPFEYSFVDQDFAKLYSSEDRFQRVFLYFGIMAIFISCLGLFGLASFVAEQRTKELGVRKVLGAGILHLWALLSGDFIKLIALSIGISMPLTYYFMSRWLQNYSLHTSLSLWIFVAIIWLRDFCSNAENSSVNVTGSTDPSRPSLLGIPVGRAISSERDLCRFYRRGRGYY